MRPAARDAAYPVVMATTCVESQKLESSTAWSTPSWSPSSPNFDERAVTTMAPKGAATGHSRRGLRIDRVKPMTSSSKATKRKLEYRLVTGGLPVRMIRTTRPAAYTAIAAPRNAREAGHIFRLRLAPIHNRLAARASREATRNGLVRLYVTSRDDRGPILPMSGLDAAANCSRAVRAPAQSAHCHALPTDTSMWTRRTASSPSRSADSGLDQVPSLVTGGMIRRGFLRPCDHHRMNAPAARGSLCVAAPRWTPSNTSSRV